MEITNEDLLNLIKVTKDELKKYYPECSNAITRLGHIEKAVKKLIIGVNDDKKL